MPPLPGADIAEKWSVAPQELVMIGDSAKDDVSCWLVWGVASPLQDALTAIRPNLFVCCMLRGCNRVGLGRLLH